ncbi:hypothetical protein L905_22115 [Agrobacterium sp. TS43]|nr:hypothetical protein L902_20490 [Agrobacterium radiobacter DSM 30147]KVK48965.1 hypothetical protein L903_20875 [Agrobacterium sp. JL28]KVK49192.1 hypothetical protein L904_20860 [Agrobacterium sp. LY4]KVK61053.1 hypothetical protein L905_22115 [Agrobacterium sp. TS43]KVK62011.1 hypothetical protein L906_19980 [Agrobacterium sp. TS45]KVK66908.1 hypothetical protein L907_19955 [Agrobacterium sp. C13]
MSTEQDVAMWKIWKRLEEADDAPALNRISRKADSPL